jgi:thioredoxin 2
VCSSDLVALERIKQKPRCGKCKAGLSVAAIDKPVAITDATFNQAVFASSLPVLVDCWAPWCGPCKMIGPILEELARTYQGRLKIVKLNVDDNPRTAAAYAIRSIPTLLFVKSGRVVDTQVGAPSKSALIQGIEKLLLS